MKNQYIMILELRKDNFEDKEFKVIRLPETEDSDTTYLYEVLSFYALKYYVHLCACVPSLDCGCLSEEEKKICEKKIVDYKELFKE